MSALQLINPGQSATMSSREIADLIEKQHSHIKVSAERLAEKGVIGTLATREFTHNGNTYTEYLLNKRDSLILVAQNCPEFTARIVDRWQELEAQANGGAFQIPQTFAQALALAAQQAQAIEVLAIERDQAVATKHLIGSKREATAMATASAAKRESERLKERLGFNSRHATVIAVENAQGCKFGAQDWRKLKTWCKTNGVEPVPVHDPRWGEAKAWPSGAWMAVFGVDLASLFGQELEAA